MNPFLKACGADGPLQLIVDRSRDGAAECRSFEQPFVLVGRDPLSDLVLEQRDVSDRHAYLQSLGGRLFCVDLGSRIGTHFGGKCQRSGWLGQRQGVRIGPYRIRHGAAPTGLDAGESPHGVAPRPTPDHTRPRLVVELSHRGLRNTLCPIEEQIALVGSAADCALRVLDPSVSNYHCSLLATTEGIWVVDLLGQGGVTLNGQEVRYARVYDGDELRVGSSALRLRYEFLSGPSFSRSLATAKPATAIPLPEPEPSVAVAVATAPAPLPFEVDLKPILAQCPEDQAELVASIIAPLVGQFGVIQQQLLDQFQQAGISMFQTFASQHHEQLETLRDELDRLRELTEEFEWLRAQMTFHLPEPPRSREPVPNANGAGPERAPAPAFGRLGSARVGTIRREAASGALALVAAEADVLPPRPAQEPTLSPIIPFERPADLATDHDRPARGPNSTILPATAVVIDEPVHEYIYSRMTAIQSERESRWRKVLRMMPGTPPKRSSM